MASNVEQRLLALEQGLLRVAALEQSHAQIAQLHEMVSTASADARFLLCDLITRLIRYKILPRNKLKKRIPRRSRKALQNLLEARLQLHRAPKKMARFLKCAAMGHPSPLHRLVKVAMASRIHFFSNSQGWNVKGGTRRCLLCVTITAWILPHVSPCRLSSLSFKMHPKLS